MTTCRVCEARDAAGAAPDVAAAALLLRVWHDDGLRARLLGVDPPHRTVATAAGVDGICDAVREWLNRL
jgi:hypothetical protein